MSQIVNTIRGADLHATLTTFLQRSAISRVTVANEAGFIDTSLPGGLTESPFLMVLVAGTGKVLRLQNGHPQTAVVKHMHAAFFAPGIWVATDLGQTRAFFRITFERDQTLFVLRRRRSGQAKQTFEAFAAPYGIGASGRMLCRMLADRASDPWPERRAVHLVNLLVLEAFVLLRKASALKSDRSLATWNIVRDYLRENCLSAINCKNAGRALGLHPGHLSRLCSRYEHQPFTHYLNGLRIERAKILLRTSDLNVKEIALRSGFSGSNYFVRSFRQIEGQTPARYQIAENRRQNSQRDR